MGDRAQVHIVDENVWLYTHWDGSQLIETVRAALSKKWRWDDPEYLARIIFDEMVGKNQGKETGFGISSGGSGDVDLIVSVNCKQQTVEAKKTNGFVSGKVILSESFADFTNN